MLSTASSTYLGGQGESSAGAAEGDNKGEENAPLVRAHAVDESASQGPRDDIAGVRWGGGREGGRKDVI